MTTQEKLAYLSAERRWLDEQGVALRREFEALRQARFPRVACDAYLRRRREHWGFLANHLIALQWTVHPPCGRVPVETTASRKVA